ncbi:MalY/PatB family protein [Desulfospira joergensenii]|uniref:MalY/PatB family protein n=1 Tax=Desulfospira joergensenii TaxID=53329 RepID=UPI0003B49475|nr:PatB family C-S lyase [Desulfospira joergensenii]
MNYNFDEIIDRNNTHSMKWGKYQDRDILPMWVADMDFKAPPPVLKALEQVISHGILGYTHVPDTLSGIVTKRLMRLYGWQVEPESILWTPGVVSALNGACRAFGTRQERIVTTTPIYPPFLSVSDSCGKDLVTLPMTEIQNRSTLDFPGLERTFQEGAALFLFCSPYNPCSTLFTREEILELTELCTQYKVILCSDEIHSDFVLDPENVHIPTASVSPEAGARTVTLMAPSKTFNIPGLGCSFVVIEDPILRDRFRSALKGLVPDVNLMGFAAARAAYEECDDWLEQLIAYLRGNRDMVMERVGQMPGCRINPVKATYLAWIDVRDTGLDDPVKFFEDNGVGLSDGKFFGKEGFVRLNFGCPRSTLVEGLNRMERALKTI